MSRLPRRHFMLGVAALIAAPRDGGAQNRDKSYRIGILQAGSRELTDKLSGVPFVSALAELGYVEGRNLRVETRYAEGNLERLPGLAEEIVAGKPDLIFAPAGPGASAAKARTTTIPIVYCFVNDPVALGFAQSLARPGGNLTGLSNYSHAAASKRVELLKEIVPKVARLAIWYSPDAVNDAVELREVESATARLGMQVLELKTRNPGEYEAVAAASRKWNADAVYVSSNPTNFANHKQIIALIAGLRRPAALPTTVFVEDGGLMTYTVSFPDLARRAAAYADKILRGAKPGELAVEQPNKLELVINAGTAKALGIIIPQSVVMRADRVVE